MEPIATQPNIPQPTPTHSQDSNKKWIIIGIVAALVLGAGLYFYQLNKKSITIMDTQEENLPLENNSSSTNTTNYATSFTDPDGTYSLKISDPIYILLTERVLADMATISKRLITETTPHIDRMLKKVESYTPEQHKADPILNTYYNVVKNSLAVYLMDAGLLTEEQIEKAIEEDKITLNTPLFNFDGVAMMSWSEVERSYTVRVVYIGGGRYAVQFWTAIPNKKDYYKPAKAVLYTVDDDGHVVVQDPFKDIHEYVSKF